MKKMERIQQQHLRHDIPKDAILMSRSEAISHQINIVNNWKPRSEVWPLVFGRAILTGAAAFSGAYINQRFRRKLKLRDYGLIPTMMGLTTAPAAATSFFHTEYVLNKLLLLEISCPLCIEYRSILLQNCTGLLLPLILTPMANFSIAVGSGVYNVPYITDVKGIFKVISLVYRPMIFTFATIFTFHTLLAGFVTYSEVKSFLRMQDVQYLIEQDKKQKPISK